MRHIGLGLVDFGLVGLGLGLDLGLSFDLGSGLRLDFTPRPRLRRYLHPGSKLSTERGGDAILPARLPREGPPEGCEVSFV